MASFPRTLFFLALALTLVPFLGFTAADDSASSSGAGLGSSTGAGAPTRGRMLRRYWSAARRHRVQDSNEQAIEALKAKRDEALAGLWARLMQRLASGVGLPKHESFGEGEEAAKVRAAGTAASALPWCASGKDYSSATSYARFEMFGCLQVSGIHVVQTYLRTIVVIDRSDSNNTFMKLPGTNQNAYGEYLTFGTGDSVYPFSERALNVKSNVFCSGGQVLPNGTFLSIGGSSDATNADPILNGSFSIRAFTPCLNGTCDFQLAGAMSTKRWYPTTQVMPDGRILIVGGANTYGNIAINTYPKNNPTVEYWPKKKGEPANYNLEPFLTDTLPFNLYPFVHILPPQNKSTHGLIFMFANNQYILFDPTTNQAVPGTYPTLNATTSSGDPIARSYPVSGTSALFPLSPANQYLAEIMICGGNSVKATYVNGQYDYSIKVNAKIVADAMCWRIIPQAAKPTWVPEKMCNWPACTTMIPRVMGDAVLLADGSVLILNGAQAGFQGLDPLYANNAQLQPLLYFTSNHSWYPTANLPRSQVARMYHSMAILLDDASVLITGSNPNPYLNLRSRFPTEFRVEKFSPPYLMTGLPRPYFVGTVPGVMTLGSIVTFSVNATQTTKLAPNARFTATLSNPGFSTHNQRHGMRLIFLEIVAAVVKVGTTFVIAVKAPPNTYIAPPGMYWLYILDSGVPVTAASPVNVTAGTSATL